MMSVLIVEDAAEMRRLLRAVVADLASVVHECRDGAEALAAYAAHRPDFVLMDVAMRETDGIAATSQIRQFDPAAKIIIVTGHDADDLRAAARVAGACAYVLKDDLFAVREVLRSAAAGPTACV